MRGIELERLTILTSMLPRTPLYLEIFQPTEDTRIASLGPLRMLAGIGYGWIGKNYQQQGFRLADADGSNYVSSEIGSKLK